MRIRATAFLPAALLAVSVFGGDAHEEEMAEMRREIREVTAKTKEIRKKTVHTEKKAAAEREAYQEYTMEYESRLHRLSAERDSLQSLVAELETRRAETEDEMQVAQVTRNNYRALSQSVTADIARYCEELVDSLTALRKYNIDRQVSALRFLSAEISAGTVDAVEGMERYYQIVRQLEKQAQVAESWVGPSPDSRLEGDVSWVRLGYVWLACVNTDNSAALIWDNEYERWDSIENANRILALREAVDLATGKAAPRLVAVPFRHAVTGDTGGAQ